MLFSRSLIFLSSLPLFLLQPQLLLARQVDVPILQNFLIWTESTIGGRQLLDQSMIQMVELECVFIVIILVRYDCVSFGPEDFFCSFGVLAFDKLVPEALDGELFLVVFEDFSLD